MTPQPPSRSHQPTVAGGFSGIGGLELGFQQAGFRSLWCAEVDPNPSAVLAARFPGTPNLGDVRDIVSPAAPDVLVGGFPCQDVSKANTTRKGITKDSRSGLFHDFARLADTTRSPWVVIENVEGLLDSNDGRDMGTVVGTLADLGYVGGWRLVDARSFGVPQARRRLLVVGHRGGNRAAVERALLDPEACPWGARPRVAAWRSATEGVDRGARTGGGQLGLDLSGGVEPQPCRVWRKAGRAQTSEAAETWEPGSHANCLNLFDTTVARTVHLVIDPASRLPRRLTEVEYERLQGFPDGWTDVEVHGRPMSSTRRYEMLGNAVPVPMAAWIAGRIRAELPTAYGDPIGDLVAEHRQAVPATA
jgi:DNA (cytosine-5)-methyltransferase 1